MAPNKISGGNDLEETKDMSSPGEIAAQFRHIGMPDLQDAAPSSSSLPSVHPPEQIVLKASNRHSPKPRRFTLLHWWPAIVFPSAYALHRYYRLHRPRRLPPLTPFKLPGLYGLAFASAMLFMEQVRAYADMIIHDKHLHTIDYAGEIAAFAMLKPEGRQMFEKFAVHGEIAEAFKKMREEDYYSSGIVGKLVWSDHNMWSDQEAFNAWMSLILRNLHDEKGHINLPRNDMKICATHFANRTSPQSHQISGAVQWSMGFSIPLAMLARWSGRRALYLPMNGMQRVLLGAWMYTEMSAKWRELWYLHRIQDKDAATRVIVNLFGSFDKVFKDMGFDYSERRDVPK